MSQFGVDPEQISLHWGRFLFIKRRKNNNSTSERRKCCNRRQRAKHYRRNKINEVREMYLYILTVHIAILLPCT